jgi:hypothetical protein
MTRVIRDAPCSARKSAKKRRLQRAGGSDATSEVVAGVRPRKHNRSLPRHSQSAEEFLSAQFPGSSQLIYKALFFNMMR